MTSTSSIKVWQSTFLVSIIHTAMYDNRLLNLLEIKNLEIFVMIYFLNFMYIYYFKYIIHYLLYNKNDLNLFQRKKPINLHKSKTVNKKSVSQKSIRKHLQKRSKKKIKTRKKAIAAHRSARQ